MTGNQEACTKMKHLLIVSFIVVGLTPLVSGDHAPTCVTGNYRSVEVVVVVDKVAYQQWSRLQNATCPYDKHQQTVAAVTAYLKAIFRTANIIWEDMQKYGAYVDFRISQLLIFADELVVQPESDGVTVQGDRGVRQFTTWVAEKKLQYDHAILLTGFNMAAGDSKSVVGTAFIDEMCSVRSTSLIQNTKTASSPVTLAHEFGHSFGAIHDELTDECYSFEGIMAAVSDGLSPSHRTFSPCSAKMINQKLRELTQSGDCTSEVNTTTPVLTAPLQGQLYNAHQLCQFSHGDNSYLCSNLYRPRKTDICSFLWCSSNSTHCQTSASTDGIICGSGKRCLAGQCVPFGDVPPYVTDSCYTEDQPGSVLGGKTCSEVVKSSPNMCETSKWFSRLCCRSCQILQNGN